MVEQPRRPDARTLAQRYAVRVEQLREGLAKAMKAVGRRPSDDWRDVYTSDIRRGR